ncbi:MAG: hypothetical protein MJZ01_03975 [Bacteroidales bacterium]|nr:hypothetical protein [Bacteroidales bacterium]
MKKMILITVLFLAAIFAYAGVPNGNGTSEWKLIKIKTGDSPKQYGIKPVFEKSIDNYMEITTSAETEVVANVMKMSSETYSFADTCIRIVYIGTGSRYLIKNIPEGRYYLKVAYGRNFGRSIVDGKENVGFRDYRIFEIVQTIYDFNITRQTLDDGNIAVTIPSYKLGLEILVDGVGNEHPGDGNEPVDHSFISEEVFNKYGSGPKMS